MIKIIVGCITTIGNYKSEVPLKQVSSLCCWQWT